MSTSISTPASLATFSQPHASSSKTPHVTLRPVEEGDGHHAVAAVQGDGIWTYDLRTMKPTSSFTVPPSTIFALPPISFHQSNKSKEKSKARDEGMDIDAPAGSENQRITAVVLEKGEGMPKGARGKTIWVWHGDEADYTTITLEEKVASLHRIAHTDCPMLAVHSATSFSLLSSDISIPPARIALPDKAILSSDLLTTSIISTSTGFTALLLVDRAGRWISVNLEGQGSAVRAVKAREGTLVDNERIFRCASISQDGVITAIDSHNHLVTRSINGAPHSMHPTLVHPSQHALSLSLPTSGKPLVVIPTVHASASLLLAIPSPTMPALLSSMPVSTASSHASITHLALLGQSAPNVHVIGVILHHGSANSDETGRSVIYTCEISVPEKGIGLNAVLGSQARTEEYFAIPSLINSTKEAKKSDSSSADDALVGELAALLAKGDVNGASKRLDKGLSESQSVPPQRIVGKIIKAIFTTALPASGTDGESESKKRGPYAAKMVTTLLEKRMVNDDMIKGGVVGAALLPLEDWDNIFLALPLLRTIPSFTIVAMIRATASSTRRASSPPLDQLLYAILALPDPAPTYRLDLKRGLDVEEATAVLQVLVSWAEAWVSRNSKGIEWDVTGVNAEDVPTTAVLSPLPTLESVITHSSHLLDSHTPLFLAHPPSYPLLTRMQAALEPLLLMQADYRALRAPLDAVLTLTKRADRDREERRKKSELLRGVYAARSGVQARQAGTGAAAPSQRASEKMGEAKIGKWKVEDFAF